MEFNTQEELQKAFDKLMDETMEAIAHKGWGMEAEMDAVHEAFKTKYGKSFDELYEQLEGK